jgi:rRNA maturation RNase YbeY
MQKVLFFNADSKANFLTNRKKLKFFIPSIAFLYKKEFVSLSYIFCSDEYLLRINKQFLHHDFYTDIITFNMGSSSNCIEGEIYISIDRVKDNAIKHNTSLHAEIHRVIFHGILHLCGFKDKSIKEIKAMREAEDNCLKKYFN